MGLQWKVVLAATGAIVLGMLTFGVPAELVYTSMTGADFSPTSAFSWFLNLLTTTITIVVSYRVAKRGTPNAIAHALLAVFCSWLIHNSMHGIMDGSLEAVLHSMTEIDHLRLLLLTSIGAFVGVQLAKRQATVQAKPV